MKNLIPMTSGVFYDFFSGYAILDRDMPPCELALGRAWETTGMFQMCELMNDDIRVGFLFSSAFNTENHGSYIITYLDSRRGMAETSALLMRASNFVLFDFPECGSLAVSTRASPRVQSILDEQ